MSPSRGPTYRSRRPVRVFQVGEPGQLVKARILAVSSGSIFQSIGFALSAAVADPDLRYVLRGLATNVVWAIVLSGVKGLRHRGRPDPLERPGRPRRRSDDRFDVGPNVRAIALALAESGQSMSITIRAKSGDDEESEVQLIIDGDREDLI